jgi:ArsR family transcriptional regulator, arsenate/arsenite/antimonite-responsive transcriptional repressor
MQIYEYTYMNISTTDFFHALADETRLRCIALIYQKGELCVCELTHALGVVQPKISRHLATLKATQILRDRREGVWVYYHLSPDLPGWVVKVLKDTVISIKDLEPFCTDRQRLNEMPTRLNQNRCS